MSEASGLQLDLAEWQRVATARLAAISGRYVVAMTGIESLQDGVQCGQIGQSVMNFSIGEAPVANAASKAEAGNWLTGAAITSTVDAITLTCEEAWRLALIAEKSREGKVRLKSAPPHPDIAALAESVLGNSPELRGFKNDTLGDKLGKLEQRLSCTVAHRTELDTVRSVRNCLVHRFGIVGSQDVDEEGELRLPLTGFRLVAVEPDGTEHGVVPGLVLQRGGSVYLRAGVSRVLRFKRGAVLTLSAQDSMDLLSMALPVVNDIVLATNAFVASTARGPDRAGQG